MTPAAAKILEASAARIELEVVIHAPKEAVWKALIERPDAWWVADLRCVPGGSTVSLEPHAGGQLVESSPEGGSLLWFTVIAIVPGTSINLAGAIAPPFGGPCQTYLYIELEEVQGTTRVRMTNSMHGHINEAMLPDMEGGWQLLLDKGLKALVENEQPQ